MKILGISAHFHESAACLLADGRLVAAAEEERFSRVKHDRRAPVSTRVRFCLRRGRQPRPSDIDCVAYYESPRRRSSSRQLAWRLPRADWSSFAWLDAGFRAPDSRRARIRRPVDHVRPSPLARRQQLLLFRLREAAVLTVDGVGEWTTTTYGHGRRDAIERARGGGVPAARSVFSTAPSPSYLGFAVNGGRVQGHGPRSLRQPRFVDRSVGRSRGAGPRGQIHGSPSTYFGFARRGGGCTPTSCSDLSG